MTLSSRKCQAVARDVSWHPTYPVIASTSFDGEINTWTLQNTVEEEPEVKDPLADDKELLRAIFGDHIDLDDMEEEEIEHLKRLIFSQAQTS